MNLNNLFTSIEKQVQTTYTRDYQYTIFSVHDIPNIIILSQYDELDLFSLQKFNSL